MNSLTRTELIASDGYFRDNGLSCWRNAQGFMLLDSFVATATDEELLRVLGQQRIDVEAVDNSDTQPLPRQRTVIDPADYPDGLEIPVDKTRFRTHYPYGENEKKTTIVIEPKE